MPIIKESGWHENDVQLRVNSKSVLGNGVMTKGYYLVIRDKTTCGCIIAEGETRHTIMGKAVARELDRVTCGKLPGLFKKLGPIHERAMKALVIEGIIKLTGVFQCSTLIPGICYF